MIEITEEELGIVLRRAWTAGMKHGIGNNGMSYPCPTAEESVGYIMSKRWAPPKYDPKAGVHTTGRCRSFACRCNQAPPPPKEEAR